MAAGEDLGAGLGVIDVGMRDERVTNGLTYCYGPDENYFAAGSWFLSMTSPTALRIERIAHGPGDSPCDDDPGTWSFGGNAVAMVR